MALTIRQANAIVGKTVLGFPDDFDGSPEAQGKLSAEQRVQLTDELRRYIAANPEQFTPDQVRAANRAIATPGFGSALSNYTIGDAAKDFGNELVDQGAKIATGFAGKLTTSLAIAAGVLVLVYLGPAILKAWKAK